MASTNIASDGPTNEDRPPIPTIIISPERDAKTPIDRITQPHNKLAAATRNKMKFDVIIYV